MVATRREQTAMADFMFDVGGQMIFDGVWDRMDF
jgi:hypothetical protein